MSQPTSTRVLVVNAGSSSLKYRLVDGESGAVEAAGIVERIGEEMASLSHESGGEEHREEREVATFEEALQAALDAFEKHGPSLDGDNIAAVGPPRRPRRRPLRGADAGGRRRARRRRGAGPARAAAQPGEPRRVCAWLGGCSRRCPRLPSSTPRSTRRCRPRRTPTRSRPPGGTSTGSGATGSTAPRTPSSPGWPPTCSAEPPPRRTWWSSTSATAPPRRRSAGAGRSTPPWD